MPRLRLTLALILLTLFTVSAAAYAWVPQNLGFEIYATNTHAWHISLGNMAVGTLKTFNATVECEEKSGEFLVTYFLEIDGPKGLCSDYLKVWWQDTDGGAFTIGKGGQQTFSGSGTVRWNSEPSDFKAGHKNNVTLTLTFLTTAAIGKYEAKVWVSFTQRPIKAEIIIVPRVLNSRSEGEWIKAFIFLPEPYSPKNIDIKSVKLWYRGNFISAGRGTPTGCFFMAEFPRNRLIELLGSAKGLVKLRITGRVKGNEFYGIVTINIDRS
jgi:hypothetical protein